MTFDIPRRIDDDDDDDEHAISVLFLKLQDFISSPKENLTNYAMHASLIVLEGGSPRANRAVPGKFVGIVGQELEWLYQLN